MSIWKIVLLLGVGIFAFVMWCLCVAAKRADAEYEELWDSQVDQEVRDDEN